MKNKTLCFAVTLLSGLALMLIWALLAEQSVPVWADPGILYVAPAGNCNGASPCYETIQAAVDAATSGEEVRVAAGIYTGVSVREELTQVVYLNKSVTIRGGYDFTDWEMSDPDANPTTLDAQGEGRVFYVAGDSPTISNLRITGGLADSGGGVYVDQAEVVISNCTVFSNTADGTEYWNGGGGFLIRGQDTTLVDNTIVDNISFNHGGGVRVSGSATLRGNTVSGNRANGQKGYGGGLHMRGDILFVDNTVLNNTAYAGGGLAVFSGPVVMNNFISGNTAELYSGGGMRVSGSATIEENTITLNTSGSGGGMALDFSEAIVRKNSIISNTATQHGGGIWIANSTGTIDNNVVVDNRVTEYDGGGSGLYISHEASPLLRHTTIARNYGGYGQGVWVENSTPTLLNTILVSHTVGTFVESGAQMTLTGTLWGSGSWANQTDIEGSGIVISSTNITGMPDFVNPKGYDYHLKVTSSAIDAGPSSIVTSDVDGEARPFGDGPDLGADEWATVETVVVPSASATLTATVDSLITTVRVPSGAVTKSVTLKYTALATTNYGGPDNFTFAGRAFDLNTYQGGSFLPDFIFSVPVTITIHYSDADVAGLDEGSLMLEYWNGIEWVDAACGLYDRHPDENWLAVPICHLSRFALFGKGYTVHLPLALRNY